MKTILLYFFILCSVTVLAQSGIISGSGTVSMQDNGDVKVVGRKTFTSHVIPDSGNVDNMLHLDVISLFKIDADLSGGIKCQIDGADGSVKLTLYAYNPEKPDKKGARLYSITNRSSTPATFSGNFDQVDPPWGSGKISSGAIKTFLQAANVSFADQRSAAFVSTDLFNATMAYINYQPEPNFNTPLNRVLKGNNYKSPQPVIVEVEVNNATVKYSGLKYPGMVEQYDLSNYFNQSRILKVTIKVNSEEKQTFSAGNQNPTPLNLKMGDLVTYEVTYYGNDNPRIDGMPGVWIARYAGDLMYYCTPSVTPGEFNPWIGYDSRVHNMQLRNKDGDPDFMMRTLDWAKRNNVWTWSYTAEREMDAFQTKYTPSYTWIKYKNLGHGAIQRNNQREGLNVQFLTYFQGGENSDFREYKGLAKYMMGFDDDELFYLNSKYHDAQTHPPLAGGGIAKLDSIPSRGMQEGPDQIYDVQYGYPAQGFPLNMQISAYQKNREWVVNNNRNYTQKYNGYEIQDVGTSDQYPEGQGLGCVKAPGTVTVKAGGQVVTFKMNVTHPISIYKGFYGSLEGNRWPASGETNIFYTLTGLNGMTHNELDQLSMVYQGCDALGKVYKQTQELKTLSDAQKTTISHSGKWTAKFNNDYSTYACITAYFQRTAASKKIMIAGKELKSIFLLFLGETSLEGKGLGAKIWLNDFRETPTDDYSVQRKFGNRIVYTKPDTRIYTFPVNTITTFEAWDGDPHLFYAPGIEWFQSSRTLAKRIPDSYLDGTASGIGEAYLKYYINNELQTSGRDGKSFTHKWTIPGTYTLKVVYRIDGVLTAYQHKINVIDYPKVPLEAKGKITVRNLKTKELEWLGIANPNLYQVFEVADIYSQYQYKEGPRTNNPVNRWAEHNDYAAQYVWNKENPLFVETFLKNYNYAECFWNYWALHYSSNWRDKLPYGLPPYVPNNMVTRVITTELDKFATPIKTLFDKVTQAKWQYTVPLVSYTNYQGYRMRTNPSCLYDLEYMFNNINGAFSTTPVLPTDPSQIQAPDISDDKKDKQEFYYGLRSGRLLIVNIIASNSLELAVVNKVASKEVFIASLNYKPTPKRLNQITTDVNTENLKTQNSIIYPNPLKSRQILYVKIPEQLQSCDANIIIIDCTGRTVQQQNYNLSMGTEMIDCGVLDISEGVYFVKVTLGKVKYIHQLVVTK